METATSEPERRRASQILKNLRGRYTLRDEDYASLLVARETRDPFRVLVVTILSQNCTDVASIRAYRNLDREIGVTIRTISQTTIRKLEHAIRVAGLHKQKARALKRIAQIISKQWLGKLEPLFEGSVEEARGRLQALPKVGPKTADVLLSVWNRPTISVDTHVDRVSKRLGFAPPKAKYEEVRAVLMRLFKNEDYPQVPLLWMAHGRRICKARKPLCPACPVEKFCPYPMKTKTISRVGHNRDLLGPT